MRWRVHTPKSLLASIVVAVSLLILAAVATPLGWTDVRSTVTRLVPLVQEQVEPLIAQHLQDARTRMLKDLTAGEKSPACFRAPVRVKAVLDPWSAFTELEKQSLGLVDAAGKNVGKLPAVVDGLAAMLGKPAGEVVKLPPPKLASLDDHAAYITAVFDQAHALREQALAKLSADQRRFVFSRAGQILTTLSPQSACDDTTRSMLKDDHNFCTLVAEQMDWVKFIGAAKLLMLLAEPDYLATLQIALQAAAPQDTSIPGVTGELLLMRTTPHGLILICGKGPNIYHVAQPVAFLADIGGDDKYGGMIASSFDVDHALSVLIDFAGNDTYEGDALGLATGRAGVAVLVDRDGDDIYRLAEGSGGAGFGGIGILLDVSGDDHYVGSKYTQGVAIAGIGLLLDMAGKDTYSSFGYAIGFGGPGGIGAVIDVSGDDSYQCGRKFASGYNASDAPNAKPGDPSFQYDAFGLGMGMGRRIYPRRPVADLLQLAGGIGMVIDAAGNDRYESSNFSQACGYFYGIGMKFDLLGDDIHEAARYSRAAGAHHGMGLFIDYAGKDTHKSAGPTYDAACAWDCSEFLFVEGGGDDVYEFDRSHGLGAADIASWAVFAELEGDDRYASGGGLGRASENALAVFFDARGVDDYRSVRLASPRKAANHRTDADPAGGLFVDR